MIVRQAAAPQRPRQFVSRAMRARAHGGALLLAWGLWLAAAPARAQLAPGDILVADFEAGAGGAGLLFHVHRSTGARTVLSDFGAPAQGPTGQSPFGVAVVDPDTVLVVDSQGVSGSGLLFRVDPTTGTRTVLSDFANAAQGPPGVEPVGILVGTRGELLVTDTRAGTDVLGSGDGNGALFRIDAGAGTRAILSDFGNPAQGPLGQTPTGLALGASGRLYVVDPDAGTDVPNDGKTGGNGALFVVDSTTGMRTMLSDFGNPAQGTTGLKPGGVALGPGGVVLVADTEGGTGGTGVLFTVDPLTGMRTVLSNFGSMAQGPFGADPFFVAVAASGAILVSDDTAGTDVPLDGHVGGNGALFAVDRVTGTRSVLSDFGNATQGPTGVDPVGVAVVPLTQPGDALVIDFLAGTNGQGALFAVDPTTGMRTLLSDFGNGLQGPQGSDPVAVAMGTAGDILVVDEDYVVNASGALLRVNPRDGARAVVSDFAQMALGPTGGDPSGAALEAGGTILVTDQNAGSGISGALFRVDPDTGIRTLLSDFGNAAQGLVGIAPTSVIVEANGDLLVVDRDFAGDGALFRVDPATGVRTLLSNFTDLGQGPTGKNPEDVTLDAAGTILLTDTTTGPGDRGSLFRLDPATGTRTTLSAFGDPTQGPTGQDVEGVAVRENGTLLVIDDVTGMNGAGTLFTVNPANGMRTVLSDFGLPGQGPVGSQPVDVTVFRVNAPPPVPPNDFLCFKVKGAGGNRCGATAPNGGRVCETEEDCGGVEDVTDFCNRFKLLDIPRAITLIDRFETGVYDVGKPTSLCNPANVNGDDPTAPGDADHLGPYQIGLVPKVCAPGSPSNGGTTCKREPDCGGVERQTSFCRKSASHVARTNVTVADRFGTLIVDTVKASRVLVPTATSLAGPVPEPIPGIDHFTCYDVKGTSGAPKFPKGIQATVVDQLQQPTRYDVVKPTRLCAPANENGDAPGAETHPGHLACYQVKPAKGQPKHTKVRSIYTNNHLGPEVHDTVKEEELCVTAVTSVP